MPVVQRAHRAVALAQQISKVADRLGIRRIGIPAPFEIAQAAAGIGPVGRRIVAAMLETRRKRLAHLVGHEERDAARRAVHIYPIPQDATFRNYRFTYDNCTGIGTTYVNNTVVWSSPTPTANQNLYWVGDGNLVIGQAMDGANNNVPNLDNFILQAYTCAALPIELVDFSGMAYSGKNLLKWSTATEKNNDYFTLEKSENGELWTVVSTVIGAGNSSFLKKYQAYDPTPKNLLNYYRLQQTDFDGVVKKFSVIVIDNRTSDDVKLLKVTDMMGRDISDDMQGLQFQHYSDGTVIKKTNN